MGWLVGVSPAPPRRSGFSPTFLQIRASAAFNKMEGCSSGDLESIPPTLIFHR